MGKKQSGEPIYPNYQFHIDCIFNAIEKTPGMKLSKIKEDFLLEEPLLQSIVNDLEKIGQLIVVRTNNESYLFHANTSTVNSVKNKIGIYQTEFKVKSLSLTKDSMDLTYIEAKKLAFKFQSQGIEARIFFCKDWNSL